MTVSSDPICDVLRRYQPDHFSLRATRADTPTGVIDLRHGKGRVVQMVSSRVSPLTIPALPEINRASVHFAVDEDALLAEAETVLTEMQAARDGQGVGRPG
jgi:ATP-dependent helicase Lhr and Lhr-like helicase